MDSLNIIKSPWKVLEKSLNKRSSNLYEPCNSAGKKENEKKSVKRKSNSPRVIADYGHRVEALTFNEEPENSSLYEVVFIVDTKGACTK